MSPATELISPAKAVMIAAVFEVSSLGSDGAAGGGAIVRSGSGELVEVSLVGTSEDGGGVAPGDGVVVGG